MPDTSVVKLRVVTSAPEPCRGGDACHCGICHCGCGQRTKLSDRNAPHRGVVKGQPLRFITGHNTTLERRADRYEVRDEGYETPCWMWKMGLTAQGYGSDRVGDVGTTAHRAMYEQRFGPVPKGMQLDHLCRNRACCNPEHLEVVTNAENTRRGALAKLTWDDINAIRAADASNEYLAKVYGVHSAHISRIRNYRVWVAA